MSIRSRIALAAALAVAAAPSLAFKPFTADYAASYMGVTANAVMSVAAAEGGRYQYSLSIKSPMASLTQTTLFDEAGGKLRPLSGNDSSTVLIKRTNKTATYDWGKAEARWGGDVKPDRAGPVKLQAGDLDGMLVNLAIARDGVAGKTVSYRMVDNGKATRMTYTASGSESITVAGKAQQAQKFSRADGDKQVLVWVVDGLPVPARILQRRNGRDEMDLKLKGVR